MNKKKKVEVFRAGAFRRKWAFRFVSSNGEKVAQSETYSNKLDAIAAANLVKSAFSKTGVTVEGEEPDRTVGNHAGS